LPTVFVFVIGWRRLILGNFQVVAGTFSGTFTLAHSTATDAPGRWVRDGNFLRQRSPARS
jgi:hypothetical protein